MTSYVLFGLAFAASALAPGPETAALVARSMSHGPRAALRLATGIVLGKLTMLTLATAGIASLTTFTGPVLAGAQILGAAYLLHLALVTWRRSRVALPDNVPTEAPQPGAEITGGLLMTLSNPIALAFYLAILPTVVDEGHVGVGTWLLLCAILVLVMAIVIFTYLVATNTVRRLLGSAARRRLDQVAALLMLAAATAVAARVFWQ